ncbi:MAG TPA: carboxypeptidase regulatory-like domain-containing protein [Polyangiaceae bacterium]|nr:carboxypeptidase regulatory-like domain-containing protein [Polyangiaceae bacterium]
MMAFQKLPLSALSLLFLLSAQNAHAQEIAPAASADGTVSEPPVEQSKQARRESLFEQNSSSGSTGLLHLVLPASGAQGTLRFSFLADWFSGSDFLCNASTPCGTATHASETHLGSSVALSVTPLPFLEAFVNLHSFANSNDQQSPGLIQVLSNTTLGAKGFTPEPLAGIFGLGGSAELRLLNGSGGVGPSGAGTSFRLAALASADLRGISQTPLPLRLTTNVGYFFDNSGHLVEDTERSRGQRITRFERFGLDVNRVDRVELGLGVEGTLPYVHPFVEWNVGIPTNRQGYKCTKSLSYSGDQCLANAETFSAVPSTLTLGARGFPVLKGLSLTAAVDIGTSGTSRFIEELAPTLPWDLWFGFGYAFDIVEPEARVVVVQKEAPIAPATPNRRIRGRVHEKGKEDAPANAIIRYSGRSLTAMASGPDGRFVSEPLEPGTYSFTVEAEGYKPGECSVTLPNESGPPPNAATAASAPTPSPASPTPAPSPTSAPSPTPVPSSASEFSDLDCELEALPRAGNVLGRVTDAESGTPIAQATVELRDSLGRSLQIVTDETGRFRFESVLPGLVSISAQAKAQLLRNESLTVRAREDATVELGLRKRPKTSLIEVTAKEIKLRQPVHFEKDSAAIASDSSALLEEVADALARTPRSPHVEIQGYMDDSGVPDRDKALSEARANAVLEWLTGHGIEASRLSAKGYGKDRPLSPNVTPQGRARNRRIQIMLGE